MKLKNVKQLSMIVLTLVLLGCDSILDSSVKESENNLAMASEMALAHEYGENRVDMTSEWFGHAGPNPNLV